MKTKPTVDLYRLQPVVKDALLRVEEIRSAALRATQSKPLVVTSAAEGGVGDGRHKPTSFHYQGLAVDIRTRDYLWCLIELLKTHLGEGWDVVEEGDHIHIERDVKKKPLVVEV
jgi:hypothetical protein